MICSCAARNEFEVSFKFMEEYIMLSKSGSQLPKVRVVVVAIIIIL